MYGKYSTRGRVERQIQHEAKPSAVFVSRHPPSAVFFVHTSLGSALTYIAFLVVRSDSAFAEQQIVNGMKASLSIDLLVHARDTFSAKELVLQWTWLEISWLLHRHLQQQLIMRITVLYIPNSSIATLWKI